MTDREQQEKLTAEQARLLPLFREKWLQIGISTERADRPTAEAAIMAMRGEIGVKTKPVFIWCDSPATSLMALATLKSWRKGGGAVTALTESYHRQVVTDELSKQWSGQHDAYWIAFYVFCRDVLGVKYEEKRNKQLDMWRDLAKSCCWWWCYENYVIISERPTICDLENGRIHSIARPAIAFADGWEVYAVRGTSKIRRLSRLGSRARSMLQSLRDSLGVSLGASLRDSLGVSLGASIQVSLGASLGASRVDSLRISLLESLQGSLGDSLGDTLWVSLADSLEASLETSLRDTLWVPLRDSLGDSLVDSLHAHSAS